jgi:RimJ/RimL family protein N-acetyltransferase
MKRDFPQTLATRRLLLRRYREEDATGLVELVCTNRTELIRDFVQITQIRNIDDASAFMRQKNEEWTADGSRCYGIWLKEEEGQIGQIYMKKINWDIPSAELSYFIGKSWQRRGYACESVESILALVFTEMQFQGISLRILPSNIPSLELARKLGFREKGLHRKEFRCGFGELHDVYHHALTAPNWDCQGKENL